MKPTNGNNYTLTDILLFQTAWPDIVWFIARFKYIWFDSLYIRVAKITTILTVGHTFKSAPTNGSRIAAPGLPWWSPIPSKYKPRSAFLNLSERASELALVTTASLSDTRYREWRHYVFINWPVDEMLYSMEHNARAIRDNSNTVTR